MMMFQACWLWPGQVLWAFTFSFDIFCILTSRPSVVASKAKNLPEMQVTWVPSLGQEDSPGGGNGNPLQYSCLGSPVVIGAWRATVHGVTKSRMQLSN